MSDDYHVGLKTLTSVIRIAAYLMLPFFSMKRLILPLVAYAFLHVAAVSGLALTLGSFNFNDSQFGNTLGESDGGTFRSSNWLNVVNVDPGNPGALTGANVNTGIANIGLGGQMPVYTIGYNTAIGNGSGNDLGIITGRFSTNDTFDLAVSTDGINFTSSLAFGPALAIGTGVMESYFYAGGGPFDATLFVTPVDLSLFGLSSSDSIVAVMITGFPEGDLIRVAGFQSGTGVPEGGTTIVFLGTVLFALELIRRLFGRFAPRAA